MTKLERHLESTDLCQEAHFSTYRDYTQNGNLEHPQNVSVPCPKIHLKNTILFCSQIDRINAGKNMTSLEV